MSENQMAIMIIMGHWISPEFTDIKGSHSGEMTAEAVLKMLEERNIAPKRLTITGNNAGNNGALCDSLHDEFMKYDNDNYRVRIRPLLRFCGRQDFIPNLDQIINLICRDVLVSVRAGSA